MPWHLTEQICDSRDSTITTDALYCLPKDTNTHAMTKLADRAQNLDSKVHGTNMGAIWGRQDPGGPHVGLVNLSIWGMPPVK